jgi:hypothetical protein
LAELGRGDEWAKLVRASEARSGAWTEVVGSWGELGRAWQRRGVELGSGEEPSSLGWRVPYALPVGSNVSEFKASESGSSLVNWRAPRLWRV